VNATTARDAGASWPLAALDGHVQITSGESPSGFRFGAGGVPYFKVQQLGNSEKYLREYNTPYFAVGAPHVPRGSVVFAKRGAAIRLNKIRILSVDGYMDTNLMALTPLGAFTTEYLFYALSYVGLWDVADVTSVPQINNKHIKPLRLPLPSEREQTAITDALSDVDEQLVCLQRLLAKKRDIKDGVMQQLLTGRTRLPGFAGDWARVSMASLGETYGGLTGKTKADFGKGDSCYIPFMDVMSRVLLHGRMLPRVVVADGEQQNAVAVDDLLFNASSETPDELALCAVVEQVPERTYLNSFCFGFRLADQDLASPVFLAYLFRSQVGRALLRALAQGAVRYNLAKAQFRALELSLPEQNEQSAIAAILLDIDAEIDELSAHIRKTQHIKRGMMQALLSGRVRLAPVEATP
jgi:type I restriction enzyme S subunit